MTTDHSLEHGRDEAFAMRIDDLLSSALQDQVREQQMMISAVQAARESLAASERDLAALRRLVEERDQAMVDMLEARLAGLAGEESIDRIRHDVVKAIADSTGSTQGLVPLEAKVELIGSRLNDATARMEALHKQAEDRLRISVEQLVSEMTERVSARVREGQHEAAMTLESLREALSSSSVDLRDSVGRSGEDLRMELIRAAGEIQMKVESTTEQLRKNDEGIEGLSTDLQDLGGRVTELGRDLERLGQQVGKVPADVQDALQQDAEDRRTWGAAMSRQLERIGESVETHLPGMKIAVTDALDELKREVAETLSESVRGSQEETASVLTGMREATAAILQEIDARIAQELPALAQTVDERLDQMAGSLEQQGPILAEAVGNTLIPFSEEMAKVSDRLRQTNRRITESNSRMEAFQESLITYLAERDERIETTRDIVLRDLVQQLSVSLGRRDRMNIARSLKDADERRRDRRDAAKYRAMARKGKVPQTSAETILQELGSASNAEGEEAKPKGGPKSSGKAAPAAKKKKGGQGK